MRSASCWRTSTHHPLASRAVPSCSPTAGHGSTARNRFTASGARVWLPPAMWQWPLIIDCRGQPTRPGPACSTTCARAFEWLVGQAEGLGFDPMRIGLIGDSAGAQLGMLLALDEHAARHIRAVVPVYGVFDLVAFWEYSHTGRPDDPAGRLMGGNPSEKPDAYFVASPLQRLRRLAKTGGKFGVPC